MLWWCRRYLVQYTTENALIWLNRTSTISAPASKLVTLEWSWAAVAALSQYHEVNRKSPRTPSCLYFRIWETMFPWHTEDMDQWSAFETMNDIIEISGLILLLSKTISVQAQMCWTDESKYGWHFRYIELTLIEIYWPVELLIRFFLRSIERLNWCWLWCDFHLWQWLLMACNNLNITLI